MNKETKCKTCGSHDAKLHPAIQYGGEVSVCPDAFHTMDELKPQADANCSEPIVTDADREALASTISDLELMSELSVEHIRRGLYDSDCRIIAAHRTRSTASLEAEIVRLRDALEELGKSHDHLAVWIAKQNKGYHMELAQIASDNAHAALLTKPPHNRR